MDFLETFKQERLKRTEENLKSMGCEKCSICNYWVDKEYIINGECNECK